MGAGIFRYVMLTAGMLCEVFGGLGKHAGDTSTGSGWQVSMCGGSVPSPGVHARAQLWWAALRGKEAPHHPSPPRQSTSSAGVGK